ncbi:MAG: mthZI [Bacillota bacterium]|nr:mthZI [Bacillota bacterium]
MTTHKIINTSAANMAEIKDKSIALVVTSPPYPMIEMWDNSFSEQSDKVKFSLENKDYDAAFDGMHEVLDQVWNEVDRVLIDGGIACINIGDATKNCNGNFRLFSNHARILSFFMKHGYSVLPDIIWRKQTNAPNKFMGSGMYPPGAYVTYEHEYILILRKGLKREFKKLEEKTNRRQSAYFWEERNVWFSDIWSLSGTAQKMKIENSRQRSGAFPFEIAYRLINMYSVKKDTVLDPFTGTGTTLLASLLSERNSVGTEIEFSLCENMFNDTVKIKKQLNKYIEDRIKKHQEFVEEQKQLGKDKFYINNNHGFEVKTQQEIEACFNEIDEITKDGFNLNCSYKKIEMGS